MCHCPSTHGSGAGSAVEVLRGWGMLIWVPGEGARVGETPPACLLACLPGCTSSVWGPQRHRGCENPPGCSVLGAAAGGEAPRVGSYSAALQECNIHKSHHLAGNNWEDSAKDLGRPQLPAPGSRPAPHPRSNSFLKKIKRRPLNLDTPPPRLELTAEVDFRALTCSSRPAVFCSLRSGGKMPACSAQTELTNKLCQKIDPALYGIFQIQRREQRRSPGIQVPLCFSCV